MKNIKSILKNFIIFIFLIIITFSVLFKNEDFNQILNIVLSINPVYLILSITAMFFYFVFESINIKSILNTFGKKIPLFKAIKYSLIEFFFSGITPAASGGQPMEIYFMHREGIPIAYSTVALLVQLICFQTITIICGIIGIIINYSMLPDGYIYIFIIGTGLNLIALITMIICLFCMPLARKIVNLFIRVLKLFNYKKIDILTNNLNETLDSYQKSSNLIKKHHSIYIKSFFAVLLQVLVFYAIPYFIYKSFGLSSYNFLEILSIQAFVYISISSIPLPGTVGISESAFITIYKTIFGIDKISGAMLLNRGINFYLFIIIGLIITLVNWIKIKNKE